MIACDTSTLIAFFQGNPDAIDVKLFKANAADQKIILPPIVLSEILSSPNTTKEAEQYLLTIPKLEILPGFWIRVAKTRSVLLKKKLKAALADTMIAQFCIDYNIALITRDSDFRNFEKYCGLKLL